MITRERNKHGAAYAWAFAYRIRETDLSFRDFL